MFENKTEISTTVKNLLIKQLTIWQNKDVKNEQQAFKVFHQDSEYLLRMLWQGRLSKMNEDDKDLNVWISENYVPSEYGFDKKKIREGQLSGLEISHEDLARYVLEQVWKDYLNSDLDNMAKPPREKVGFFKNFFK